MIAPDQPYSLQNDQEREYRHSLILAPHIAPLTAFVDQLRDHTGMGRAIPYFDPLDGGVNARCLLLLEAPGRQAVKSGFVSRNNPDPTAKNWLLLLEEAGLRREDTVIWNVVPWYVGEEGRIRAVRRSDVDKALQYLRELLGLLLNLRVVVLVGRKAQLAKKDIARFPNLQFRETLHPSNLVLHRSPMNRRQILESLLEIKKLLT